MYGLYVPNRIGMAPIGGLLSLFLIRDILCFENHSTQRYSKITEKLKPIRQATINIRHRSIQDLPGWFIFEYGNPYEFTEELSRAMR